MNTELVEVRAAGDRHAHIADPRAYEARTYCGKPVVGTVEPTSPGAWSSRPCIQCFVARQLAGSETDEQFFKRIGREQNRVVATVSFSEPNRGPGGYTVHATRTMFDGATRAMIFRFGYDFDPQDTDFKTEMYNVILDDFWKWRSAAIARYYGLEDAEV